MNGIYVHRDSTLSDSRWGYAVAARIHRMRQSRSLDLLLLVAACCCLLACVIGVDVGIDEGELGKEAH